MRLQALIAAAALVGACGDDDFHPASLPQLVDHGGLRLTTINLVAITYPNDPLAPTGVAFDDAVLRSSWLDEVAGEYGIHGGTQLATYVVPHPAAALMTDDEVLADLRAALSDQHAVPGPTVDGVGVLYMIYLPATTTVMSSLGTSCQDYGGYHSYFGRDLTPFALIADCGGGDDERTMTASHEIIEAATDPDLDALYADAPEESPWHYWDENEVGDMCETGIAGVREGGFLYQRTWSQAASEASQPDPCVPVPPGDVWASVDTDPNQVIEAAAGDTVTVDLRGWSSRRAIDWPIDLVINTQSQFSPVATLSEPSTNDGRRTTLTMTVPDGTPPGLHAHVHLWSGGQLAPVELLTR